MNKLTTLLAALAIVLSLSSTLSHGFAPTTATGNSRSPAFLASGRKAQTTQTTATQLHAAVAPTMVIY